MLRHHHSFMALDVVARTTTRLSSPMTVSSTHKRRRAGVGGGGASDDRSGERDDDRHHRHRHHHARKHVRFSDDDDAVIGRADDDVDRTPRAEPARCSCCALHVVGYAFGCATCARAMARFELCAMCFGAHAHLSRTSTFGTRAGGTSGPSSNDDDLNAMVAAFRVHDHAPECFVRTGDEDQMALDEILSDRRNLMVNGRGSAAAFEGETSPAKTLSRASSGRSSDEAFDTSS